MFKIFCEKVKNGWSDFCAVMPFLAIKTFRYLIKDISSSFYLWPCGQTAKSASCWGSTCADCEPTRLPSPTAAAVSPRWSSRREERLQGNRGHAVKTKHSQQMSQADQMFLPSIRILKTSLVMGSVVPRTRSENRNVQMGSATLYSGCEEQRDSKWDQNKWTTGQRLKTELSVPLLISVKINCLHMICHSSCPVSVN